MNSARISSVQAGKKFTWIHARAEVLRSLTDITYTVRFLALARLKRQTGTAAKLWISQVLTRKALLEDPKLPAPITLPEALYLEILVGQMSAQETTVFDCPSIGDDLSAKDGRGRAKFILERIKRSIDDCSNPPHFRGVKTPVTDIMDPTEPKIPKEKRDQTKHTVSKATPDKDRQKRDQTKDPTKTHLARRPSHEQPNKFPTGLKRPDLDAVVEGKKIASEAQRQLYDDIKRGQCTRCHKGGHVRRDCKEPQEKWEEKFDKEKEKYWESVAKWQSRATPGAKPPPTLHVKPAAKFASPSSVDKPEHRASSITSDTDDDDNSSYTPLHYRMTIDDDPEDEETQNDETQIDDTLVAAEVSDETGDASTATTASNPTTPPIHFNTTSAHAPTPEALAAIFSDVTRQLTARTDDQMNEIPALLCMEPALSQMTSQPWQE